MITKKEYELLADWIKEHTCGCIYSTFTGKSLEQDFKEYYKKRMVDNLKNEN